MSKLDHLNKIANEMLQDINPREDSFQKILLHENKPSKLSSLRYIRALSYALSLLIFVGLGFHFLNSQKDEIDIEFAKAGQSDAVSYSVAAVPRGSVVLNKNKGTKTNAVFAGAKVKPFPMLTINGDVYRMLRTSADVSSLLAASLGNVDAFNSDITAEDINSGIKSNIIPAETEVFSIDGMEGAAVAAEFDGQIRAFQRVSFSGNAVRGGESLLSTLGGGKSIVAMQLSDVGVVNDSADIDSLVASLQSASYKGASAGRGKQTLLVEFENGLIFQLGVKGSTVMGCGSFSCEDFVNAFRELAAKGE